MLKGQLQNSRTDKDTGFEGVVASSRTSFTALELGSDESNSSFVECRACEQITNANVFDLVAITSIYDEKLEFCNETFLTNCSS